MSEIADFLRARIAERRTLADSIHRRDCESLPDILYPGRETGACDCGEPEAVIADCDAKLALVDLHRAELIEVVNVDRDERSGYWCSECDSADYPCRTLGFLAQPFAGHPDHKGEEWGP